MTQRKQIERALEQKARYTINVGSRKIEIKKRDGSFHIIVTKKGKEPQSWLYRDRKIALDRFEEQCEYFRRALR